MRVFQYLKICCKSHKDVAERMVSMVNEYEIYEVLKEKVTEDLRDEYENLEVEIFERDDIPKTKYEYYLGISPKPFTRVRLRAEEYIDLNTNAMHYPKLISELRVILKMVTDNALDDPFVEHDTSKIFVELVNKCQYDFSRVPHRDFCGDIKVVYRYLVKTDDEKIYSTVIGNKLMEILGIASEEELNAIALDNSVRMFPAEISSLKNFMFSMVCGTGSKLYYLTTNSGYGSAAILYPNVKDMISEHVKGNYYIFPYFKGGLLIIPEDADDVAYIKDGLKRYADCISQDPNEFLSKEFIFFDAATEKFSIVE